MIVRFTYWMSKDWTSNDQTPNDRTSKDSTSKNSTLNDWTSNDWTSNRTQHRNRDPITNDWTSNRTQFRKTEHWIWTPKDWTSKNSTASYYDIIVEILKLGRILSWGHFLEVQSFPSWVVRSSVVRSSVVRSSVIRMNQLGDDWTLRKWPQIKIWLSTSNLNFKLWKILK